MLPGLKNRWGICHWGELPQGRTVTGGRMCYHCWGTIAWGTVMGRQVAASCLKKT